MQLNLVEERLDIVNDPAPQCTNRGFLFLIFWEQWVSTCTCIWSIPFEQKFKQTERNSGGN